MTPASDRFTAAQSVADALLYEGYVLYPYRASAAKNRNRLRWQFGVLVPPGYRTGDEPSSQHVECLVEPRAGERAVLHLRLRFLQSQARRVEAAPGADGRDPWDEVVERHVDAIVPVGELLDLERDVVFSVPGGSEAEETVDDDGIHHRVVRERHVVEGGLRLSAHRLDTEPRSLRVVIDVRNTSPWARPGASRDEALRRSLIGAHTLVSIEGGDFVSLLEPPEWAAAAAEGCEHDGAFPVLVGATGLRDLVLCSPILLYDHPRVAPESPGDLYDATEIDEILTLRTLTLTEEEKREARATDPRSAAIIDRVDSMTPEAMRELHGTIRHRSDRPSSPPAGGSTVRLQLGRRRSDVHDIVYDGRLATVWDAVVDSEGRHMVRVTIDDDPAADIHREQGRFLYFGLDEIELV